MHRNLEKECFEFLMFLNVSSNFKLFRQLTVTYRDLRRGILILITREQLAYSFLSKILGVRFMQGRSVLGIRDTNQASISEPRQRKYNKAKLNFHGLVVAKQQFDLLIVSEPTISWETRIKLKTMTIGNSFKMHVS